jgi:hypothetical protein
MAYFDAQAWDVLIQDPLWHKGKLWDEYTALMERGETAGEHEIKKAVRSYFADRLDRGMVALGREGSDLDAERRHIDTIVIHHTSGAAANYTLSYLNAVQLLRIYAPRYRDRNNGHGLPIRSDHFYQGQQVFWGYHWFIFEDGRAERILPDTAIGWHSGVWDVNTRSAGICFAGNFMERPPNRTMLAAAQTIIRENYADKSIRIIGHYEAPRDTTCPGDTFAEWRSLLRS